MPAQRASLAHKIAPTLRRYDVIHFFVISIFVLDNYGQYD